MEDTEAAIMAQSWEPGKPQRDSSVGGGWHGRGGGEDCPRDWDSPLHHTAFPFDRTNLTPVCHKPTARSQAPMPQVLANTISLLYLQEDLVSESLG